MPDIRAIAMKGATRLFGRDEEGDIVDFRSKGGDISMEDAPRGKKVWVSVGRGWREGRVLSFDGETYRVQTKKGIVEVPEDRVLTEDERRALKNSSQDTIIRR